MNTDFTLNSCLFASIKLTKNADLDKYKYNAYGIGFDNKNTDVLILEEGPTQRLDDSKLAAKSKYPVNFVPPRKRLVLSLDYNGSNGSSFVIVRKIYQFKARL